MHVLSNYLTTTLPIRAHCSLRFEKVTVNNLMTLRHPYLFLNNTNMIEISI